MFLGIFLDKSTAMLLGLLLAGLFACACTGDPPAPAGNKIRLEAVSHPRNLILVSLDTLRSDRLGCYGCPEPVSPWLDRFSLHAQLFSDVIAQAPSTVTSHQSLFTAQYLSWNVAHPPAPEQTLAGILSASGRNSCAFVDGGLMNRQYGNAAGFEEYDDEGGGFARILPKARRWLQRAHNIPFFLFLHTYDIHCPYTPPMPYGKIFSRRLPTELVMEKHCGNNYFNRLELTSRDFSFIDAKYMEGVRYTDAALEEFFRFLQEAGRLKDTVVAILSDHGESLGERRYVGHRQLYDVQIRVPLLACIPGHTGRLHAEPAELIDVAPTLLHALGVQTGERMKGDDLFRAAPETAFAKKTARISENHNVAGKAVYHENGWKLIIRSAPQNDELYRPLEDPEERNNLANAHPDVVEKLLELYRARTGVTEETMRKLIRKSIINFVLRPQNAPPAGNTLEEQLRTLGYIH